MDRKYKHLRTATALRNAKNELNSTKQSVSTGNKAVANIENTHSVRSGRGRKKKVVGNDRNAKTSGYISLIMPGNLLQKALITYGINMKPIDRSSKRAKPRFLKNAHVVRYKSLTVSNRNDGDNDDNDGNDDNDDNKIVYPIKYKWKLLRYCNRHFKFSHSETTYATGDNTYYVKVVNTGSNVILMSPTFSWAIPLGREMQFVPSTILEKFYKESLEFRSDKRYYIDEENKVHIELDRDTYYFIFRITDAQKIESINEELKKQKQHKAKNREEYEKYIADKAAEPVAQLARYVEEMLYEIKHKTELELCKEPWHVAAAIADILNDKEATELKKHVFNAQKNIKGNRAENKTEEERCDGMFFYRLALVQLLGVMKCYGLITMTKNNDKLSKTAATKIARYIDKKTKKLNPYQSAFGRVLEIGDNGHYIPSGKNKTAFSQKIIDIIEEYCDLYKSLSE